MIWSFIKGILLAIGIDFYSKKERADLKRKVGTLEGKATQAEDAAQTARTELEILRSRQEEEKKIEGMSQNEKDEHSASIADKP